LGEARKVVIGKIALADAVGRDFNLLGQNPRRQLLGRHLQGEEPDHGTLGAVGVLVSARRVVGDVGSQGGFAHGRPTGQHQKVRCVLAAELLVEVPEPGEDAAELAVALVRHLGQLDGADERGAEILEAAFVFAAGGEIVKALLGFFDLLGRRFLDIAGVGVVDHVLAELDELAPKIEVVDDAPVFAGIDDGDRRQREFSEIGGAADLGQALFRFEEVLQGYRVGDLGALDEDHAGFEYAAVLGHGEVLRTQKIHHFFVGTAVGENGAEERFLGLDVMGLHPQRGAADRRGVLGVDERWRDGRGYHGWRD
jgi:hypothetical protein